MRVANAIAAGAIVAASDLGPAACDVAGPDRAFRYDVRSEAARAVRDLRKGEIVEAVPAFALPEIRPGQRLYVRAQSGPVLVEREVEALQAARPGGRLFVRAVNGAVFSAVLPEARP